MLQSLINKDNIVKKEILEVILKTNNSIFMKKIDFILKNCLKIRKIETFLSSVILLNKNNYFGNYSLIFNKELLDSIISKDKNKFIEIFSNPEKSSIFNNDYLNNQQIKEIKYYFELEKISYCYLYHKKYYDCMYKISLEKIQELKKEIYTAKNIQIETKYFSNKNTISIRKGKEIIVSDIIEVIFKIFENISINEKLDYYVKNNYKTEYLIIKNYVNRFT